MLLKYFLKYVFETFQMFLAHKKFKNCISATKYKVRGRYRNWNRDRDRDRDKGDGVKDRDGNHDILKIKTNFTNVKGI